MKNKTKILLVILIVVFILALVAAIIAITKPKFAKDAIDGLKNIKAFVDVKTSKKYNKLDSKTKYYKKDKNIKIPILLYHEITKKEPERKLFYMQTTDKQFEKQISGLLKEGYTIIDYDDLVEYNRGKLALSEKTVLLAFDDGWLRKL